MPKREEIFIDGLIYHVFNKSIDSKKIFEEKSYCSLFLNILKYYRSTKATLSYSLIKKLEEPVKTQFLKKINLKTSFQTQILCYCIMPTHFHLLMKQVINNGVLKTISNTVNSFTRIFNIRKERLGPLFLPRFKSVLIRTEEQLKHVSRYIHLNPYSEGIVTTIPDLFNYQWSSIKCYLKNHIDTIAQEKYILSLFNNKYIRYKRFIEDRADYQKSLEMIKHTNKFL